MVQNIWVDGPERHQKIAKEYYDGIQITHPPAATGGKGLRLLNADGWAASCIKYLEYRG